MLMLVFKMEIITEMQNNYIIKITDNNDSCYINFNTHSKNLLYINNSTLTEFIKLHEFQLRKMLHNKRRDTFFVGFNVQFVLRDNKDVLAFNDRNKLVVLDNRNNASNSYVLDAGVPNIYKIFTDASFLENKNISGVAFIIEDLEGNYTLHTEKFQGSGSSQAELIAAIKALTILKDVQEIRIITDSQYVRKGLTEWMPCWKLKGYKTINGESVKNIENWLKFEQLCQNKYIEFQWIKGHTNHFENSLCDLYAREIIKT